MSDVAPPATAEWYDPAATVAAVLAVLRLSDGDVDHARIEALVPAAGTAIDMYLDWVEAVTGPPPPAWAQLALEAEAVARYRSGGPDVYMALGGAAPSRGSLAGGEAVESLLRPHKARYGVS